MKAQKILVASVLVCGGALSFAGCSMGASSSDAGYQGGTGGGYFAGATSATAGTGYGSTAGGGISGMVGAACATDEDCGGVLSCLGPDADDPSFGGGPAGGFCSRACTESEDCPGSNAVCLKDEDAAIGRCTIACALGPPLERDYQRSLDEDKCHGRADVRCEKVKNLGPVCLPTCGSDAQCGPGRVCDPSRAMCVSAKHPGLPTGATCDATATPTACAGRCVSFDVGSASCSSPCVLGGSSSSSPSCGGPTEGLCAFGPPENGAGDLGFCTRSCKAHSECATPAFWCFGVAGLTEKVGNGYCFGATPCKSQSDCSSSGKETPYVCTPTPHGSFCLDATFPFQKAAGPVP